MTEKPTNKKWWTCGLTPEAQKTKRKQRWDHVYPHLRSILKDPSCLRSATPDHFYYERYGHKWSYYFNSYDHYLGITDEIVSANFFYSQADYLDFIYTLPTETPADLAYLEDHANIYAALDLFEVFVPEGHMWEPHHTVLATLEAEFACKVAYRIKHPTKICYYPGGEDFKKGHLSLYVPLPYSILHLDVEMPKHGYQTVEDARSYARRMMELARWRETALGVLGSDEDA